MMKARISRILVVDDEPLNLTVMAEILRPHYTVIVAKDAATALDRLQGETLPDLILLDVMMPGTDGLQLCAKIKSVRRTNEIPVIFVTALNHEHDETRGFEMGAVDYVTKPISPPVVLARIKTHLALRAAQQTLRQRNAALQTAVAERAKDLIVTQDVTIRALASLAEARDKETGAHILRTQHYIKRLAEGVCHRPGFAGQLSERTIELIFKSAPLHDIGKVGIPDRILLKPSPLTSEEFEIMKSHAAIGRQALLAAIDSDQKPTEFLQFAIEISGSHHEKWDGSGYPEALKGDAIPLSARLMAVADVYDALTTRRVYKTALEQAEAVAIIDRGSGRHFDPDIVEALHHCLDDFQKIAAAHADPC